MAIHHREPQSRLKPPPQHPVREQARRVLYDEGAPDETEQGEHPWVGLRQEEDDLTGSGRPSGPKTPGGHRYGDRRARGHKRGPADK